jgi:hypothetical protein
VTFVVDGRLMSISPSLVSRCLLDGVGAGAALRWNGAGDKVILPDGRVDPGPQPVAVATGDPASLTWSYPTGTAVLEVDRSGHLYRIPSGGGSPLDITFLARHDAATYHPAGTHVVSSGLSTDGTYGLWVATNRGADVRLIARGETAPHIDHLTWTANHQLLFVADHGDHKDLHQLDLVTEKLVTVLTVPAAQCFESVVASRLPGGGVAWAVAPCDQAQAVTTSAVRGGSYLALAGTDLEHAAPVGFLPDGTLVATSSRGLLSFGPPGSATVTLLHPGTFLAAMRVIEPPSVPIELPEIPAPEAKAPG